MAVGKGDRGRLWVDGEITFKLRGPGPAPGRIIRVGRPFALIGRHPGADIRIDDPAVAGRHALLVLDRRGVFGVDLVTESGTRFAGAAGGSAWLGAGDILEVAGHRVELLRLRVEGRTIDPSLSPDDPLAAGPEADGRDASITLESLDAPGAPWTLGSTLAFLGRGDACAIRIEDASAAEIHCALLRSPAGAHVIDIHGFCTTLNDRPVDGAAAILDGDVLIVGRTRFGVRVGAPPASRSAPVPSTEIVLRDATHVPMMTPVILPADDLMAMLVGAALRGADPSRAEVLDAIRRLQGDAASILGSHADQIDSLRREIEALRDEIRGRRGPMLPPAEPLRLDLRTTPPRGDSVDSAAWLLDRINGLEPIARSTWKDLLTRIASAARVRPS